MNDMSRLVAHRLRRRDRRRRCSPSGRSPTHPIDFLFTIAAAGTTAGRQTAIGPTIVPFGDRRGARSALSLLQAQWTYTGYDASAHVAEETV